MRFAIGLPNVGAYGDPGLLVELGSMAEQSGWDGVFIWDHVAYREPGWPVADPQVAVAALAASTKHVRLGVLMVALPRRRPWKVARELASLDVLSGGRATFGAGLGSQALQEYEAFGEQGDAKVRAERLDEALEVVVGPWSGAPFTYQGKVLHGHERPVSAAPGAATQDPRMDRRSLAGTTTIRPRRALGWRIPDSR